MTTDNGKSCSLSPFDILKEKHPPGRSHAPECLLHPSLEHSSVHPILYDNLNADTILQPLHKCSGVGVSEVPRRIIAKAVLRVIGHNIEEAGGPLQVCAR